MKFLQEVRDFHGNPGLLITKIRSSLALKAALGRSSAVLIGRVNVAKPLFADRSFLVTDHHRLSKIGQSISTQ